jgi:hypothetical protein
MAKAEIHFELKPISIIFFFSAPKGGAIQNGLVLYELPRALARG